MPRVPSLCPCPRAPPAGAFASLVLQLCLSTSSTLEFSRALQFHPFWHEDALVEYCMARNITVNGYSPLGAPDYSFTARDWNTTVDMEPVIVAIAKARGCKPSEVALRWSLQQGVLVNPRSRNPIHMHENLAALAGGKPLSGDEMRAIAAIKPPQCAECNGGKVCPDPSNIP